MVVRNACNRQAPWTLYGWIAPLFLELRWDTVSLLRAWFQAISVATLGVPTK
jgi:hypothetical protein